MKQRRKRWSLRVGLVGGVGVLAFAALASVGAAVSPSGTPAASEAYKEKVLICHRTGSKKNPFRTIRVSKNAEKAHLRHGDRPGPCATATFVVCQKGQTKKVKGAKAAVKQLRKGAKLGKCKAKKAKPAERSKGSDKGKPKKEKAKPANKPLKGGEKGKQPKEAPGNPGDRGKKK
jgi:hypothetical protein